MRPWACLFSAGATHPLLIGVSGGADSMALAFLASRWTSVFAVIVDHALRPESSDEAHLTASRLKKLGIPCRIIRMNPALYPKGGGIQERARYARFEVFHNLAAELQADKIALAHHQGDQDETLLMRWRGMSGTFGLAGIRPCIKNRNLFILRPLLNIPAKRLRQTLLAQKIEWCEDPSNQNRHYERVRIRQDITSAERMKVRRISALARCQIIFQHYALFKVWKTYFKWHDDAGWAEISEKFWDNVPPQLAVTVLRYAIQLISASAHPPSFDATKRLYFSRSGTLGAVMMKPFRQKSAGRSCYFMVREIRGLPCLSFETLFSSAYECSRLWAGTWRWEGEALSDPALEIRPLAFLKEKLRERDLPFEVAQSLPSLWKGDVFLGCPHVRGIWTDLPEMPFRWARGDFFDKIAIATG